MAYGMRRPTVKAQALANLIEAAKVAKAALDSDAKLSMHRSSERQQLASALNFYQGYGPTKHLFKKGA